MNFEEAIDYLDRIGNEVLTMNLGLDSIRALSDELGRPEESWPAVHIAGTNGKGSTSAMVEAILRAAGHRTGLYTSPHLLSITERARVVGEEITRDQFARMTTLVREACTRLVVGGRLADPPTIFEQLTAIAWSWFAEQVVGIAVLEVGMGGRLDATNICRPIVTAITPVGLDHQEYLGETVAEIAGEKAGIIKHGVPVIVAPQESSALAVIRAQAARVGAPLREVVDPAEAITDLGPAPGLRRRLRFQTPRHQLTVTLSLRGRHQMVNSLTALEIIDCLVDLGWSIPESAIVEGLESTVWPGRLELVPGEPPLLLDGAHNPAGALALRDFLAGITPRPIIMIFGVMRDKDIAEIGRLLLPLADRAILTAVDSPRSFDPFAESRWPEALRAASVPEALTLARRICPPEGLIVACGSLYLVREVKRLA